MHLRHVPLQQATDKDSGNDNEWQWKIVYCQLPQEYIYLTSQWSNISQQWQKWAEALAYGPQQGTIYEYKYTVHWYTNLYSV